MRRIETKYVNGNGGEWSSLMGGRMDLDRYNDAAVTELNTLPLIEGGITRRPGTLYLREREDTSVMIPFRFSDTDSYMIEFGVGVCYLYTDRAIVLNEEGEPFEFENPFLDIENLQELKYTQSFDVLYLVGRNTRPYLLKRRGVYDWVFEEFEFLDGPYQPVNTDYDLRLTFSHTYAGETSTITATKPIFSRGDVGSVMQVGNDAGTIIAKKWEAAENVPAGAFRQNDGTLYHTVNGGTTGNIPITWKGSISFSPAMGPFSDGTVQWNVVNDGTGWLKITEYVSPTIVKGVVQRELPPDIRDGVGTFRFRRALFSDAEGWPVAVLFHDQRLIFARDRFLAFSKAFAYPEFRPGTKADDSFILEFGGTEAVFIQWLAATSRLVVGTSSGPYMVQTDTGDSSIDAVDLPQARLQDNVPCSSIRPVIVSDAVLFATRSGRRAYQSFYSIEKEGMVIDPLTQLASHILGPGVIRMEVQNAPYRIVWFLLRDGTMAALTYDRSQSVYAWSRFQTKGRVLDICVIPSRNPARNNDEVYLFVERTVDVEDKFFIEVMADVPTDEFGQGDFVHADCSLRYRGPPVDYFARLDFLNEELVSIYTEYGEHPQLRVRSGTVRLDHKANNVVIGIPFESKHQSFPMASFQAPGNLVSPVIRSDHIYVKVWRTSDLIIGFYTENGYSESPIDLTPFVQDHGRFPMYTGTLKIAIPDRNAREVSLVFRSRDKALAPFTVLAVVCQLGVGDDI